MPTFKIHHITRYEYDRPVRESANQIKLFPYLPAGQEVLKHDLRITNDPLINRFEDYWGNTTGLFMVPDHHAQLEIDSRLVVATGKPGSNQWASSRRSDWQQLPGSLGTNLRLLDLSRPEILHSLDTIRSIISDMKPYWDAPAMFIQRCSEYIFSSFTYQKGITTVETTVDEILQHRRGVCQDFAHVLLEMLRLVGIPSRYVSGYICPNKDGARGAGATHAWVEAWLPSTGWVGIDPTNNTWVGEYHVPLAVGRHFNDCSPVKGTFKGPANQQLLVHVSVNYEDGTVQEDETLVQLTAEPSILPPVAQGPQQQQQ